MDRRNFFKILSASGAGALTSACGPAANEILPLLVPEGEIVPGEEQWHPAVCGECAAGCATLVRVMEGRRVIKIEGERVRERRAAIKKIEGNPLDPVSGGRLCARGQAAVQALYHPDRLREPMKRLGDRGAAQFAAVPWDEAIAQTAAAIRSVDPASLVFLTGAAAGTRSVAIARFLTALGAPPPVVCALDSQAVERAAAGRVFGWRGLPVYDLANATYALGVGVDFLGGWASPVYYARQFGEFRQGRHGVRGTLVQAESRLSVTAAAADRWLPLKPGSEPQFLFAVGALLLAGGAARANLPAEVAEAFATADVTALLAACGVDERRLRAVVEALGESDAPLVIGGASATHTNSLDAVIASHWVNVLLGNVGKPGGVLAPADRVAPPAEDHRVAEALSRAQVVLIEGANPAYTLPASSGVADALRRVQAVISFAPFLDDSAAWADLILPPHHDLESESAQAPAVARGASLAVQTPFVKPLYETRAVEQTLADLARTLGLDTARVSAREIAESLATTDLSYAEIARQGGVWREPPPQPAVRLTAEPPVARAAEFNGDGTQFPLLFQPYLSLQFHDGRSAHLPWMQELPDPASSAMWELPVEIDLQTAARLSLRTGDRLRIESEHGAIEAPVYVHPGAVPGVASMAIGGGHTHYTRYASGRGANPLSILAPTWEDATGVLATGATRVRLTRAGGGTLTQYSAVDREGRGKGRS